MKVVRLHPEKTNQEVFPRAKNWWDRWRNGTGITVPKSLRVVNPLTKHKSTASRKRG